MGGPKIIGCVVALLVAACSSSNNRCVPGASNTCTCSDGSPGQQICIANGTFDACSCQRDTPPGQAVIGPNGGTLTLSDGTAVDIPAGALSSSVTITIQPAASGTPLPSGVTVVGAEYLFGPEGLQFAVPATVTLAIQALLLPRAETASDVSVYTAAKGSDAYVELDTTLVDSQHVKALTTHFSTFAPGIPEVDDGGMDGGVDAGTDAGSSSSTGTGGGTTGGIGTTTGSGTSTGGGGPGGPFVCPSVGAVGCGTLSAQGGPYGNFVHESVYPVTMGTISAPIQSVPAIIVGDGTANTFQISVAVPTCPTGPGVVMEEAMALGNFAGGSRPIQGTASVDFLEGDGGLVGTIVGGADGIVATFAFPASLGAGGVCVPAALPPTVFGPPSICSAGLDAGCTGTTDCAELSDGGQPTGTGILTIPATAGSTCDFTYAPTPVTVTMSAQSTLQIQATSVDGWEVNFSLDCCPAGLGTVPVTASFYNSSCSFPARYPFSGLLTVLSLDGGLAGNLYANGAAVYFSFDPNFTSPMDAGPAGSFNGSCYPCQSSGDDGGAAEACALDSDCCEGSCVIDAGSVGLCQ